MAKKKDLLKEINLEPLKKQSNKKEISKKTGNPVKKYNYKNKKIAIQAKNKNKKEIQKLNSEKAIMEYSIATDYDLSPDIIESFIQIIVKNNSSCSNTHFAGCPSKYRSEFCNEVIRKMAQGKSVNSTCIELGIMPDTFKHWCQQFPEFLLSFKIGKMLCERWWEEQGRQNLNNKNFNHVLWMMNMTNRFKWLSAHQQKKIDVDKKVTETKTIELTTSDEKAKEVLEILENIGAISVPVERTIEAISEQSDYSNLEQVH